MDSFQVGWIMDMLMPSSDSSSLSRVSERSPPPFLQGGARGHGPLAQAFSPWIAVFSLLPPEQSKYKVHANAFPLSSATLY